MTLTGLPIHIKIGAGDGIICFNKNPLYVQRIFIARPLQTWLHIFYGLAVSVKNKYRQVRQK